MRFVLTVNLKDEPGIVDTYRRHHREVWPDVQASLRRVGVEQMSIYLLGRRLVMVVEMRDGVDYRSAFEMHVASTPKVAEWERLMAALQERTAEAREGEWWAVMEPVFHLNQQTAEEPALAHVAERSRTS